MQGKPYSQFGHAVSSLGDVNYDGCMDFAVGAPNERHEEEDGSAGGSESTGAVYIYLGSRDWGLMDTKQPSQILYAKQFERHSPSGAIHRFGYSFARRKCSANFVVVEEKPKNNEMRTNYHQLEKKIKLN